MPITGSPEGQPPLVGQVTSRTKLAELFALQFAVQLLHEAVQRRSVELQTQIANGLVQDFLETRR